MPHLLDTGVTEEPLGPASGMPLHDPLQMVALTRQSANMAEISSLMHTLARSRSRDAIAA